MDFAFIGGSMGAVVGEKSQELIDYSIKHKIPFVLISKSGGARMMEAAFSLMQLAKTSAKLAQLAEERIPYISLCTDPTTVEQQLLMLCLEISILENQEL